MDVDRIRRWLSQRKWETRLTLVSALVLGILIGTLVSGGVRAARETAAPLQMPSPAELSSVFTKIAKQVEPAVVNISTTTTISRRQPQPRKPMDPFEDFFERFFDFGIPDTFQEHSVGSGVIVDAKGYILTNYHVVRQAETIDVRLHGDSKKYKAEVIGHDEETDLAVIRINAGRDLPVAELGDSSAVQVGDWVLAIGSPFGLEATVTAGIISYKGREGQTIGGQRLQLASFLQTDAAINRGNSGGPLVNLAGQIIGINTSIATAHGGYSGVGFALASNIARNVYNQIIREGRVVRGSIGIEFRAVDSQNEAILRSFGAKHGVLITEVRPGSPAAEAGLERGDVIVAINGKPVHNGDDLVEVITATPVGNEVKLRYLRNKKEREVAVRVESRRELFPELYGEEPAVPEAEGAAGHLGLRLEETSPALLRRWGLDPDQDEGLLVRSVEPNSFAEDIGVERGDLILEFNQQRVRRLGEFREIQRRLRSGSDVVFGLKRRLGERWVWVYLGGTLP